MTRHVLVTGGAGFIGSHIVDAYLERGWRVSVIDNLSTGDRANVNPRAELHVADLRDPATCELVTQLRPDVVNHQAAQVDVRTSVADPATDAEINIIGSLRLLQKSFEAGVRKVLFASSGGATYGEPLAGPQDESHPQHPLSPYGCAKLTVEHYLHYFREVHGLQSVALRYANVYGPRQNAHGEAGVVAIFAAKMLAGEEVTINGDGTQTRDFVYVGDVVAANMAATDRTLTGAYNVGTSIETSINELHTAMATAMAATVPNPLPPRHAPAKKGEQLRSVLDARRIQAAGGLGEWVQLLPGLRETMSWFREHR